MTTEHYLWAIFALLWIALVLVIVTARRGPWDRPMKACVPVQCPDQEEVVIDGLFTVVDIDPRYFERPLAHYSVDPVGNVRVENTSVGLLASGVDPLWGKNQP